jgi:hypothetical protein
MAASLAAPSFAWTAATQATLGKDSSAAGREGGHPNIYQYGRNRFPNHTPNSNHRFVLFKLAWLAAYAAMTI